MFHLGELMNHAALQQGSCQTIINHLVPIFEALLRQHPVHAINGATLAFGLVSALRASEYQLSRRSTGALPRPAADTLLQVMPELLAVQPDLLVAWESRTLALLAKYGVQYLRQLGALGQKRGRLLHAETLQLNAARALKPVIEEARRLSRGIWDQRDTTYRRLHPGQAPARQHGLQRLLLRPVAEPEAAVDEGSLRIAGSRTWPIGGQPARWPELRCRGAPRNPASARGARRPGFSRAHTRPGAPSAGGGHRPLEPPAELGRFSQAAGELLRLGEHGDRFDREEAISATNALIISIEAGRTRLNDPQRVQMLLDMDSVCMRLYAADPFDAPQGVVAAAEHARLPVVATGLGRRRRWQAPHGNGGAFRFRIVVMAALIATRAQWPGRRWVSSRRGLPTRRYTRLDATPLNPRTSICRQ